MPSRPLTPTLPDLASLSLSTHTLNTDHEQEDWDQDMGGRTPLASFPRPAQELHGARPCTPPQTTPPPHPRNSVAFPGPAERYPASFSPGRATRFSTVPAHESDSENESEVDAQKGEADRGNEGRRTGRRTLSALLRLHSERGATGDAGRFSEAEAARIADVLGQWINSSSSPYESAADDFAFIVPPSGAQDDTALAPNKRPTQTRPRGRSEGVWANEAAS